MRPFRAALLLMTLASSNALHAATVYKCVDAKGAVAFQDHPCASSARQITLRLPDAPPPPPAPADDSADDDSAPAPEVAQALPQPPPPPPQIPPPNFYLCTRYDGSRYMSDTGQGGSALVPLGVLGIPGRSLADAYGGPNGIGVSAPGLRTIPRVPAGRVPFGGMDTWIDDECHLASPPEACAYLRSALDDVTSKLRRAFSDTEAQLKEQQAQLQQNLRGC
jgi:hypothetical protein